MSSSATAHAHVGHAEHHELGFVRTYIFSTDHKMIARQFLFLGLLMMVLGGLLALIVRWQLAWPETAVPFLLDQEPALRAYLAPAVPPGGLLITGTLRATPPGTKPFQIWNSLEALNGQAQVVASYDKIIFPANGQLSARSSNYLMVDKVEAPNPTTVVFHLKFFE